jgi:uncharacterized protein (DUF697 family)/tellurite resistance protein
MTEENSMNEQEQKAVLTLCLMAAFADGAKSEAEREEIRRIAEGLEGASSINLASLYQDVLFRRISLAQVAAAFQSEQARQFAFELAVSVCDADGARTQAESDFLADLRQRLGVAAGEARRIEEEADAIITAPVPAASGPAAARPSAMTPEEMDGMVLNYAILNGALELLPQSLASMSIIALQMKMVYRIGKAHGFELDQGHIKEFLATLGVGLTSQYVEQFGRKLVGGLLGKFGGGLARKLGAAATGSAFSFASTYALGQVARSYYAGGRSLDSQRLKERFDTLLQEARGLQSRYAPQIEQKARSIDPGQLLRLVREQ